MRYPKIEFEQVIKELEFTQFYELCKILEVDVVDRDVFNEGMEKAKETNTSLDTAAIKMRRDFDKMIEELIEKYHKLNRKTRRQLDPILSKIVWGNRQARKIGIENMKKKWSEAKENVDEVVSHISENTDMAAIASGDGQ